MRIFSILAAALVVVGLYFLVLDRERLMQFAGVTAAPDAAPADAAADPAPDAAPDATAEAAAPDADADAARPVSVVALHSQAQVIDSAVRLRGETSAAREVTVRAETTGQVVSDPLRKGSFVEAGQLLCEVDPGTREAQLAGARAALAEARARLPEAQAGVTGAEAAVEEAQINETASSRLSQGGYASDTQLASARAALSSAQAQLESARSGVESARSGIQSAEAQLAAAQREIELLQMHAPFAGLLESDTAELGSLLQPGSDCATVIQLDPIKLVGFVPETSVDKIAPGASATARLISGREVTGQVTFLSRSADPTTRTFRMEVDVENADLAIRDGQTVDLTIASDGAPAHLVPSSALTLNDDGVLGLRTVTQGDIARFVPVAVVRDTLQGSWVTGLPDRADIIVLGQEYVSDGVPVTPHYRESGL